MALTVTRTFRVSGIALVAGILLANLPDEPALLGALKVLGILTMVVAVPVFAASALRHLVRPAADGAVKQQRLPFRQFPVA